MPGESHLTRQLVRFCNIDVSPYTAHIGPQHTSLTTVATRVLIVLLRVCKGAHDFMFLLFCTFNILAKGAIAHRPSRCDVVYDAA